VAPEVVVKQSRTCPKCEGRRVAVIFNVGSHYMSGEDIRDRYWCTECGYSEIWYRTPDVFLEKLEGGELSEDWAWHTAPKDGPFR